MIYRLILKTFNQMNNWIYILYSIGNERNNFIAEKMSYPTIHMN